jgi:hypothetical protein
MGGPAGMRGRRRRLLAAIKRKNVRPQPQLGPTSALWRGGKHFLHQFFRTPTTSCELLLLLGVILFSSAELRTLSSHSALAKQGHVGERLPHMEIDFSDFLLYSVMGVEPLLLGPHIHLLRAHYVYITIYPNENLKLNAAHAGGQI